MSRGITDRGNQSAKAQRQEITTSDVWGFLCGWMIENKAQFSRMGQEEVPVDHTKKFILNLNGEGHSPMHLETCCIWNLQGYNWGRVKDLFEMGAIKLW